MTLGELWTLDFELAVHADHYPKSLVTIRVDFRRTQIIIPNHWSLSPFKRNGDWGLGIGDWGLGIGDWGLGKKI